MRKYLTKALLAIALFPYFAYSQCPAPTVVVMGVTSTSVDVAWVAGGSETRWKLEYSLNSMAWTSAGTVTTTSHTFSGLQPNTQYYFRVGAICPNDTTYAMVRQATECFSMRFPFRENFDRCPTSSPATLPSCWTLSSNYSSYPSITTSNATSSPNCLYMYNYTYNRSNYVGIVTPMSPEPLNRLQVSFTIYKSNTSYKHAVVVGALTNPNDYSTFVPIDTAEPGNATGYYNFTLPLKKYRGNAQYIGIYACGLGDSYSYPYLDDIEVDYYTTCSRVTNLQTQSNSPTSAVSTWQNGRDGIPEFYIVSYTSANSINWITDTTHSTYKVFSNLASGTTYYIAITPVCLNGDTSYATYDTITTSTCITQPMTVGSGGSVSINVPIETDVDYGYAQQIYDSADLGGPKNLSAIAFNYRGSRAMTVKSNCTIYLANVSQSTFVPNQISTLLSDTLLTQVYAGSLNCVPGWNIFPFDTTFHYDGHSNLLVAIDDNSGNNVSGANFSTHATTGDKSAVIGTFVDIDPAAPIIPPTVYSYRNDITLYFCDTTATCAPPTAVVTNITDTKIKVAWAPGLHETRWILERSTNANGPWTYVNTVSTTEYDFTGLNPSTLYYFRVGSICTNDTMYCVVSDTTDCGYITTFPLTESFESYSASSARTSRIGLCWGRLNNNNSQTIINPYVYRGIASQGNQSMYFNSTSSQYALLSTPPMGVNVSRLMLTFDIYRSNSSYYGKIAVGVMTDPGDISTFIGIDTVWGNYGVWETFIVPFDHYVGTGKYIALVAVQNEYTYVYVDNLRIDTIPACPKPTGLQVANISSRSAFATWLAGTIGDGIADHFIVEMKPSSQAAWVTVDTTSNAYYFFSNLAASTTYDVRIKGVCTCGDTSEYLVGSFKTADCLIGGNSSNSITGSTTTSYYLPVVENASYSYTQQIFTPAEIGGQKFIEAVEFYYSGSSAMTDKDTCVIYLGHTTRSTFASNTDYVAFADLTPVYSGSMNSTFGWNRFTFTTPFFYNGVDNLVIAIDDNSGSYPGTTSNFYVLSANSKSLYFSSTSDIDPMSPSVTGYVYNYRNSAKFISQCNNSAPCVQPNVRILNTTSNTVEMMWVPGSTDSLWVVLYKPSADSIWRVADTTADTLYTLRNLSAISRYDIRVMSLCGGDSAYADFNIKTDCGAVSIYPYTENFESYSASSSYTAYGPNDQLPDCWTFYSSGTNRHARRNDYCPRIYGSSNSSYLPNNSGKALLVTASNYSSLSYAYNYQTVGAHHYAVLPEFVDSLPRLTVSFKYRMSTNNTTTNYGMLCFGYVLGDTNFTTIASYPATTSSRTVFMDLSADTTIHHVPGARLAFRFDAVYSSQNYVYFCIDDVEIGWAPTCWKPYDIKDVSIDSITTKLLWKDATVLSTTLGYEVVWGSYGFEPDTATVNYASVADTFITLTNLQPNTIYQCYVRALCGIDGNSVWSIPHTFRTAQIPANMPYNCNFESTATPDNGWTFVNPTYGNNAWIVGNAVGNNSNRSMYISNTGGILNDYATTTAALSWAYRDIYVPFNNGNNFNLKFDWRADGENNRDYMAVYFGSVSTAESNDAGTLVPPANSTLVGRYNGNGNTFSRVVYQLPQLSDTVIRIYFAWVNDANSQGSNPPAAVDNVSVKLDCPEPTGIRVTNITQTSARVSWRHTTGAYHWMLEYRPDGLNQWTSVDLNDTTYTITGLTSSMSYYVRVRCMCTSIDTSEYSDSVRFNTLCGQIRNFPYVETFDSYGTSPSAYPTCWSYAGSATRPNCSATTYSSAPASLYFNTAANTQAIAITPRMKVFNPYELELSFRAYSTSTSSYLIVGLMSDSTSTQSFIGVDTVRVNSANRWFTHVSDLSSYTGVGQFVGFKVGGSAASNFNIDDIIIDYHGADCADPTGIATMFGTNYMHCTWNEVANYEFQYCILGDTIWSNTLILNNTNYYYKTGLIDSTTYIWRIRTICPDSAGYSHWNYDTITTYALPCNPIANIVISNITDTEITLKWDSDSNQNAWEIHCFDIESGVDTVYTVYSNPCRLTGLITGLTYHFSVRSLCTSGLNGGWSDTVVAIVAYCKPVKNVHIIPVSASSVNITWDITDSDQNLWEIEYGLRGFYEGDGTGTTVITATNSYTLTGLNFTTTYDVFVRARCSNGFYSIWTQRNRFALADIDVPQNEDNEMFLYPNPATEEVYVLLNTVAGEYTMDVVDMKGRIVKTKILAVGDERTPLVLDISDLARGTYFVKISNGETKAVRKLIAQ